MSTFLASKGRAQRAKLRGLLAIGALTLVLAACMRSQPASTGESPMKDLFEVRNVSVSVHRSPSDVYAFVSNGENIPRWATGLGDEVRRLDGEWLVQGPLGTVKVRFARPNELGVADHDVALPTGVTVHNPIRVVPNGAGSTVIFTIMRLPEVSEEQFEEDANAVQKDLSILKRLLEQP